jgi:hypothetical protein
MGTFAEIKDSKTLQPYNFVLEYQTTPGQDRKAIEFLEKNWNNESYYSFFFHNCAHAAIGAIKAAGVKLPMSVDWAIAPNKKHHLALLFGTPDAVWQRNPLKNNELESVTMATWDKIKTATLGKAIFNSERIAQRVRDFFRAKDVDLTPGPQPVPFPMLPPPEK